MIQAFGDIFKITILQYQWLFWLPSKYFSEPAHIWILTVYSKQTLSTNPETVQFISGIFITLIHFVSHYCKIFSSFCSILLCFEFVLMQTTEVCRFAYRGRFSWQKQQKRSVYFCKQPFKLKVNKVIQLKFKCGRDH